MKRPKPLKQSSRIHAEINRQLLGHAGGFAIAPTIQPARVAAYETAIRAALDASRAKTVRVLLTELVAGIEPVVKGARREAAVFALIGTTSSLGPINSLQAALAGLGETGALVGWSHGWEPRGHAGHSALTLTLHRSTRAA